MHISSPIVTFHYLLQTHDKISGQMSYILAGSSKTAPIYVEQRLPSLLSPRYLRLSELIMATVEDGAVLPPFSGA